MLKVLFEIFFKKRRRLEAVGKIYRTRRFSTSNNESFALE